MYMHSENGRAWFLCYGSFYYLSDGLLDEVCVGLDFGGHWHVYVALTNVDNHASNDAWVHLKVEAYYINNHKIQEHKITSENYIYTYATAVNFNKFQDPYSGDKRNIKKCTKLVN